MVAAKRGGGFDGAGTVLLSEAHFDAERSTLSRLLRLLRWPDFGWAPKPVRGDRPACCAKGWSVFGDAVFEKQFGADATEERAERWHMSRLPNATRRSRTAPLEVTCFNSVSNKGAMVWRLAYNLIGRDQFIATLRELLAAGKTDPAGLSLARVRAVMAQRGGAAIGGILDQEFDQPTDMDLMVGLPQQQAGQWTAALRNLGSFEARVSIVATTANGQRLVAETTIPAQDFGQVKFQSPTLWYGSKLDPDKKHPQQLR